MTELDKIAYVRVCLDDSEDISDDVISAYLLKAKAAILNRRYIIIPKDYVFPTKYEITQCDLAVRYIKRRDIEGEISHNENGVIRSYNDTNDEDLLSQILPVAVIG